MKLERCGAVLVWIAVLIGSACVRAQGLPAAAPETVGMSGQRLGQISAAFKREIEQGNLPGVVVMVARKGRLVYADAVGFQNQPAGKPMSKDAIFRIYSMTKPLVSVAAMMLVEEGRIELTDPVSKFLPALKQVQVSVPRTDPALAKITYTLESAEREMTVQDLLRHSAGLAYGQITQNTPVRDAYTKARLHDPAGDWIAAPFTPGELLLGTSGYTFGLGFAVRQGAGMAGVPGSANEFMSAGYGGTYFWIDPQEQIAAVYMSQAPSPIRAYYRKLFKQLVYSAIVD